MTDNSSTPAEVPAPPAAQVPPPPAPSVGVMWVNAALAWGVLPGIYLLYLTVRNISWAVSNGRPWVRYAMPLATIIALLFALLIIASMLPSQNSSPYGTGY